MITLCATLVLALGAAALGISPPPASADTGTCAATDANPAPGSPSPGNPCWTDVTPYPFGFDGNPVDPSSAACNSLTPPGPNWQGDMLRGGTDPQCYQVVTSMAFRAWNRGLAATSPIPQTTTPTNAFGVWLFNGTRWFPDPTFPGSSICPGSTVLWAGKLDYWLIGPNRLDSSQGTGQTLCRFDGVNFEWQALTVPPTALALFKSQSRPGGITAGACYAWNNCWFFGTGGVVLHWDGLVLSYVPLGLGSGPWLGGDFTAAVARTDASGNPFGYAITRSSADTPTGVQPLPPQPGGAPPPELFGSQAGPFAPLPFSPPAEPQLGDPYTTDLTALDFNSLGSGWVAGELASRVSSQQRFAVLSQLTEAGVPTPCVDTFTSESAAMPQWKSVSVLPDGSAFAGAFDTRGGEPVIIGAACGQGPSVTRFRVPDPRVADQSQAAPVPADAQPTSGVSPADLGVTAVAANAVNQAWAATGYGALQLAPQTGNGFGSQRPHFYQFTDGLPPAAPAGDDMDPRPSLFTLDAPVFVPSPPVFVNPPTTQQRRVQAKPKHKKLKPPIYAVHSRLVRSRNGKLTLYLTFKVRYKVTIGAQALRGKKVVSSSGMKTFRGKVGRLALPLDRKHWPTRIRFVTPKKHGK